MASSMRVAFRFGALSLLVSVGTCSDHGRRVVGVEETSPPVIVSDPSPNMSLASPIRHGVRDGRAVTLAATPAVRAAEEDVAYISLPPGTVPNGVAATIRNRDTGSAAATLLADGGFDP